MPENTIEQSTNILLQYGALGVFVICLIISLIVLGRYFKKRENDFLTRTDAFIEVTRKYAKTESEQTEVMRGLTKSIDNLNTIITTKLL